MEFLLHNLTKIILAISVVVLLILVIRYYAKIKTFLLEVKTELGKVSWSSRQELTGSTIVVIVVTSITALFIFIIDSFLTKILSLIFK